MRLWQHGYCAINFRAEGTRLPASRARRQSINYTFTDLVIHHRQKRFEKLQSPGHGAPARAFRNTRSVHYLNCSVNSSGRQLFKGRPHNFSSSAIGVAIDFRSFPWRGLLRTSKVLNFSWFLRPAGASHWKTFRIWKNWFFWKFFAQKVSQLFNRTAAGSFPLVY